MGVSLERFRRRHRLRGEHLALLLGVDEPALAALAEHRLPDPSDPDFVTAIGRIAAETGCELDALRYILARC